MWKERRNKGLNPLNFAVMFLVLVAFFAMLPISQQLINDTIPELNSTSDRLIVRAMPAVLMLIAFIGAFAVGRSPVPEV